MQRNLLSMSQIVVPNMPFYVNLLKLFDVISSNNVIYLLNYISISKNFLSSFKLRLLHFLYFSSSLFVFIIITLSLFRFVSAYSALISYAYPCSNGLKQSLICFSKRRLCSILHQIFVHYLCAYPVPRARVLYFKYKPALGYPFSVVLLSF